MVKFIDILFWILILVIVGILIWLAFGSPEFESSLIAIGIFVASSEVLLWKALFAFDKRSAVRLSSIDKKTSIGFERVKLDFERVNDKLGNVGNRLENMNNKLINIESDANEIKTNLVNINKKLKVK